MGMDFGACYFQGFLMLLLGSGGWQGRKKIFSEGQTGHTVYQYCYDTPSHYDYCRLMALGLFLGEKQQNTGDF